MKYAKQGPREFVPFEYSEVTLQKYQTCLQSSLLEKFDNLWYRYSPLSKDHPACSRLDQIPNFKVIYVRFIITESRKSISSETLQLDPFESRLQHKKCRRMLFRTVLYLQSAQRKENQLLWCQKAFSSRYVEIWEDHQTCRKKLT